VAPGGTTPRAEAASRRTSDNKSDSESGTHATPAWRLGSTDAEVADTEDLIRRTQAAMADLRTVEQAQAQGFVRVNADHMVNPSRYFDRKQLDPTAIEALVIGDRDGRQYVRGAMYQLDLNQTARDVPRRGGPLMVWHGHGQYCFDADGTTSAPDPLTGGCPATEAWLDDPPMIHIYLEPQADDGRVRTIAACGTFVYMDLPMDRSVPGCGPTDGSHHMAGMPDMAGMSHG